MCLGAPAWRGEEKTSGEHCLRRDISRQAWDGEEMGRRGREQPWGWRPWQPAPLRAWGPARNWAQSMASAALCLICTGVTQVPFLERILCPWDSNQKTSGFHLPGEASCRPGLMSGYTVPGRLLLTHKQPVYFQFPATSHSQKKGNKARKMFCELCVGNRHQP